MNSKEESAGAGPTVWRGALLGLALAPVNALWIVTSERVRRGPYVTSISLLFNVVFCLLVVTLLNAVVRRLRPRWALTRTDLVAFYSVLAVCSVLAGMDMAQGLVMIVTTRVWFANPNNRWGELFRDFPPRWLQVNAPEALRGFYEGETSLYRMEFLRAWAGPFLWWGAFAALVVGAMLCLTLLLHRRWQDEERLTFPIAQIPLAIITGGGIARSRLFWLGFGVSGLLGLMSGLSFLYPRVPALRTGIGDFLAYFPAYPWRAAGWLPVTFYPAVIGISFLLPTDILFSCWFFYWWWKLQPVLSAAFGWDQIPEFPYLNEQLFGSVIGIALGALWLARGHLWRVARSMVGCGKGNAEERSYRRAGWGLFVSLGFLAWFGARMGMTAAGILGFFAVYFLLSVAVTRVRAEFGSPVHDFHFIGPDYILPSLVGSANVARGNLSAFTLFWWFNRAYRSHPMPHQIEAWYLSSRTSGRPRAVLWPVTVAGLVGVPLGIWAYAHLAYRLGAEMKFWSGYGYGHETFNRLSNWLSAPLGANVPGIVAAVLGVSACFVLWALRARFAWWPLHPVGYAIAGSWSINLAWMPMLISWACKVAILRYGGLGAYRKALPLFLGLVLGEVVVGCGWSLLGIALRREMWSFWGA